MKRALQAVTDFFNWERCGSFVMVVDIQIHRHVPVFVVLQHAGNVIQLVVLGFDNAVLKATFNIKNGHYHFYIQNDLVRHILLKIYTSDRIKCNGSQFDTIQIKCLDITLHFFKKIS